MEIVGLREVSAPMGRALIGLALVMALGMVMCGHALADSYSATDPQGNTVRLYEEPCAYSNGWLKLKKAWWKYQGKEFEACWYAMGGAVIVFDSSGEAAVVPIGMFTKDLSS